MTERELDQRKSELVRALRRRAAELDAVEVQAAQAASAPTVATRRVVGRRAGVAYYARDTFRTAALTVPARAE